ncbi:unnamed protein product, partial [Larinioides sclopetarius]
MGSKSGSIKSDENGSSKSESEDKSDKSGEDADQQIEDEKPTTSLRLIVKKTKLYLLFHIKKHVPDRSYVYFHRQKTEPIPSINTFEEACKIMPRYFELGYFSQHPLICIDEIISSLYKPMFTDENRKVHMPKEDYPVDETQVTSLVSDFNKEMAEFTSSTKQIISQIEKPFMFSLLEIPDDINLQELAQETEYVTEAEEMTSDWISVLSDFYNEIHQQNVPEDGLLYEVEFWKTQKLKLNICADQMSHPTIEKTIQILKLAEKDITKFEKNVMDIENLLKRVTDNVAYLSLLEKSAKLLLSKTANDDSKQILFDIFVILKVAWVQSEYYSNDANLYRLLKGIATLLKKRVKEEAKIDGLFRKPLSEISKVTEESIEILKYWKKLYFEECEKVKKYGTSYWWRFDTRILFDETDHVICICEDLGRISQVLQELYNIFNTNLRFFVEDMKVLSVLQNQIFGMTTVIQYSDIDAFDSKVKPEWDRIIRIFFRDVKNFEDQMKQYIGKMFQSTLSWENAYILARSFDKVTVSPSIREFILKSRTDMLKQFIIEISETENQFLAQEREPPLLHAVPETASAILWVRDLLIKISKPMSKIRDFLSMDSKDKEALTRFKKTEKMLAAYKKEKYEAWKVIAHDKLNKFLQTHVLKKFQPQSSKFVNTTRFEEALLYKVNFPTQLEEVSVEAKLLEALGYEIPSFVKNIILQENSFYQQRNKIKLILEELSDSLSDLKREEISTLEIPIENLCSVLDLGRNQIQWESTDIPDFIKKSKQAVDIFRGFVNRIKNIVQEIDKKVKSLSTCDLFQFMKIGDSVPSCEAFFEDAKLHMQIKVQNMVNIYSSLEPLLKKLELISCRTSTGRAPQMREYYYACEEKILKSITMMMLSNLEYFRDEVLEHFLFPYVEAAFQSEDELVSSSIIRIKLIFLNFMKTAIESTRKLIRWLDG